MTIETEKAINDLQQMKKWFSEFGQCLQIDMDLKSFDVAIKALLQEPCEDTISRKDALNVIENIDFDSGLLTNKYGLQLDILKLPSVQSKQTECEDAISRKWLVEALEAKGFNLTDTDYNIMIHLIRDTAPSVQPKYNTDEWCHNCSEYDHEKHCCPRFNRVIRNTVEEIKQPKTGQWVSVSEKFPEYGEAVLTINTHGDYEINHIVYEDRHEWLWDDNVVAWMPLPEVFEPQESEEEYVRK